jgi:S-methylmethionine-dependent homocysteine/selenocysteine methylase
MRGEAESAARAGPAALCLRLHAGPPLLLDGALGTELERRGAAASLPLWSTHALLASPELVQAVHADYVAAGAEVLTANTFRTQRRVLARAGIGGRARELSALAVGLARRAAAARAGRVFVVGSAPPLEDCYEPERVPEAGALAVEHAEHAENLAAAGVDAILVETMNTIREAVAAARAARAVGLPCLVSFVCQAAPQLHGEPPASGALAGSRAATLLGGEPLADALAAAASEGADAVLVNCLPIASAVACLPALRAAGPPWGVYANLGAPGIDAGPWSHEHCAPAEFAERAAAWLAAGARITGGCCGTGPAHIEAIARRLAAGV